MRVRTLAALVLPMLAGLAMTSSQARPRLNPVIDLLAQNKPVFGLYAPANPRQGGRGRGAATTPDTTPRKTPAQLAADAVAYKDADLIFDGGMEGAARFDAAYATFSELARGMTDAGSLQKSPAPRLSHPLFVKTPKISTDTAKAREFIARQLDLGVTGIVLVDVESAEEVKQGLAAMRYASQGGTRPDRAGVAPAAWGMSEKDYKAKADVWPLNPNGELVNWTIVESKEGIARVREIAAVKGIGALFPGAGTLRGVYTRDSAGRQVRDVEAWEAAIQQVLSACKEYNVPCGFPVGDAATMELRMKQGFTVFIINWSAGGFAAVDAGRKLSGR